MISEQTGQLEFRDPVRGVADATYPYAIKNQRKAQNTPHVRDILHMLSWFFMALLGADPGYRLDQSEIIITACLPVSLSMRGLVELPPWKVELYFFPTLSWSVSGTADLLSA